MIRVIFALALLVAMPGTNGGVSGVVMDSNASLFPGVQVRLLDSETRRVVAETFTNLSGAFHFGDVKPGGYFISAYRRGFREHVQSVVVKSGQAVDIDTQRLVAGPTEEEFYPEGYADSPTRGEEFTHLRRTGEGVLVITVCEFLKEKSALSASHHAYGIVVIGSLMQTAQGSWLQESCGDSLKSGDFIWPNAVALREAPDSERGRHLILPKWNETTVANVAQPTYEEIDSADRGQQWVAAYGTMDTRENLVAVSCGDDGKLCGYGYGPINAPAQLTYENIHFFDKSNH